MPTSYTQPLYNGEPIDFATFVLRCSRAMMPTVVLRDSSLDELPTEKNVTESDYHSDRLTEALNERERLLSLTAEEADREAERANAESRRRYAEEETKQTEMRARYEDMLAQVESWQPPTEAHAPLKEFMAQQIAESMRFDAHEPYVTVSDVTGAKWLAERLARVDKDIAYHSEELAKQKERNAFRVEWVRALRESLETVHV